VRGSDSAARSSEGAASGRPYEGKIKKQIPHPLRGFGMAAVRLFPQPVKPHWFCASDGTVETVP